MTPAILVNATAHELRALGGDVTFLLDVLRLPAFAGRAAMVSDSWLRRASVLRSRLLERACVRRLPAVLRRALLVGSRWLHVGAADLSRDVILSHLRLPALPRGPRRCAIVWSTQGIAPAAYYDFAGRHAQADVAALFERAARHCDLLVVWTEDGARRLHELVPALDVPVRVIHAPCPVREPRAGDALARKTGRRLLFVGVDAERKGLGEVLAAIPGVRRRFPHITLDVVSRPRAALRRALSRLPYVRWHASARAVDVGQLMAAADVLLMPTQADTYGLAAVEAMAHGCAIVTSDLPPLPELFPDQLVGCTVPVRDARELERQVSGLLAQPERLRVLQRNARQRYLERHAPAVVERALLAACAEATMRFQQRREGSDHEHRPCVA